MKKNDKINYIDDIVRQVKQVPITDVGQLFGIQYKKIGSNYFCKSPFRNSSSSSGTSFSMNNDKGIFRDWTSDELSGDSIKLFAEINGINYYQAIFELATALNIISEKECSSFLKNKRHPMKLQEKIEKQYNVEKTSKTVDKIASPKDLDYVYKTFIKYAERKNNSKYNSRLSVAHYSHLKDVRGLTDEEIENQMFFTMPDRTKSKALVKEITEHMGSDDVLGTVPGFFKTVSNDIFTFKKQKGIGIPYFNEYGQLVGIQVRLDNSINNSVRYIWFTSSFAIEGLSNVETLGTAARPYQSIIYPILKEGEKLMPTLFITEGVFKGLKIAKTFKCAVIVVPGVTSHNGIERIFKKMEAIKKMKFKFIYMAFDADMSYNLEIYKQAKKITDKIPLDKNNIFYVLWDEEYGKGIDDLINEGYLGKQIKYPKVNYDIIMDKFFKLIELEALKNNIKVSEVKSTRIRELYVENIKLFEYKDLTNDNK